jgi:hypothetical protein
MRYLLYGWWRAGLPPRRVGGVCGLLRRPGRPRRAFDMLWCCEVRRHRDRRGLFRRRLYRARVSRRLVILFCQLIQDLSGILGEDVDYRINKKEHGHLEEFVATCASHHLRNKTVQGLRCRESNFSRFFIELTRDEVRSGANS